MSGSCSSLSYVHLSSTLVSVSIYFLADQAWQVVPTFNKPEHPDMQCFYHTDWAAGAGQGELRGETWVFCDLFWTGTEPLGASLPFPYKKIQTTGLCMSPQTFVERAH